MNSRNSSKPPSSDSPFDKPAPTSLRPRGVRKPGGQIGHPGATLRQAETPDVIVAHEPAACTGCGRSLAAAMTAGIERRQVFDLPPITVHVTEHRLLSRRCACGIVTRAVAPSGVAAPVQYGPRVQAACVYLYAGQFLSKDRTATALSDLLGVPLSAGTVATITARASHGLSGFTTAVTEALQGVPVAHFDETGFRVAGKNKWVHSASTGQWSLLTVHDKRGRDGMNAAGVLPVFRGIAVHDAWAPYDTYEQVAGHGLCGAHVLRELQAVIDYSDGDETGWAGRAAGVLRDLLVLVRAGPGGELEADVLAGCRARYLAAVTAGIAETAARVTKVMKKHNALAKRMRDRVDDYLRFTVDPGVSFDNNAAERELRMVKVKVKVSGGQRTMAGAEQFVTIRSYLHTARKHGVGFFDALTRLADGHPWLPATT